MPESILDALDYLQQGGWVMIPLSISSVVMWILILERVSLYQRYSRRDNDLAAVLLVVKNEGNDHDIRGLRGELIQKFIHSRFGDAETDRHVLRQLQIHLRGRLRQRLALIGALAAIAPLLGLLGTVLGMMESFEVISVFGTGNSRALAGGISMALVTTQAGLVVAIPGLLVTGWMVRKSKNLENSLDEFVRQIDRPLREAVLAQKQYGALV